ncbi:ROK family protein [Actinosynnema sp. CS-041913]|uniref:ROK family protein n=1 Tax=Actinosynnema sp. CS-041913 TaxID=3239917 RepID=UPI003D8AA251
MGERGRIEGQVGLIVVLEATQAKHQLVRFTRNGLDLIKTDKAAWDPALYVHESTGTRLAEEMVRRARRTIDSFGAPVDSVAVTLPGTLSGTSTVMRSTRLGIYSPVNLTEEFHRLNAPPCHVFHDTECLAIGEARQGCLRYDTSVAERRDSFAYVLADEGIGSSLFVDGRILRGAGSAGHLGRLVVEPRAAYHQKMVTRGALEVFASRPWISHNIVSEYVAEQGKSDRPIRSNFRSAVAVAATTDWSRLGIEQIAEGITDRDPIAHTVLDDAARYLGIGLNSLITIANPPSIVLGGALIEGIESFYEMTVSYARRFTWALAWSRTRIVRAELGRRAQLFGAAELLRERLEEQ